MLQKTLKYYSFILVSVMSIAGFLATDSLAQLVSAIVFYPVAVYFWLTIVPKRSKALDIPLSVSPTPQKTVENKMAEQELNQEIEELSQEGELSNEFFDNIDIDRRAFIKLIGSAGISVFLLSIFTKRAQAAFFGSVPGPGTVALKDTSGNQIDPAQHHPTDGYKISQLDDSTPAFYGFTNSAGAWFIMKEDASGNYRYAKGASDFSTNWTARASLTYDYFENVF